jgi:hypothetical protein
MITTLLGRQFQERPRDRSVPRLNRAEMKMRAPLLSDDRDCDRTVIRQASALRSGLMSLAAGVPWGPLARCVRCWPREPRPSTGGAPSASICTAYASENWRSDEQGTAGSPVSKRQESSVANSTRFGTARAHRNPPKGRSSFDRRTGVGTVTPRRTREAQAPRRGVPANLASPGRTR